MNPVPFAAAAAALSLLSLASAQTVTEIGTPTVEMVLFDFDTMPLGPTSVAAVDNEVPGYPFRDIVLTPSAAAPGVYNTNAGQNALALTAAGLAIIDGGGSAAFTSFDGRIDLQGPSTEIGFAVGDWNGPMIIDFYNGGVMLVSHTSSTYTANAVTYYQMAGGTFDRIDVRASTTAGNWVFGDIVLEVVVTEISRPTVGYTTLDFDTMPLGGTSVAAMNAATVPQRTPLAGVSLTPSTAGNGVYDTNAGQRALARSAGGLTIIDGGGTATFLAFNARVDLRLHSTEIGFGIGDWMGPMIIDFYDGAKFLKSYTSSTYSTNAIKIYAMHGARFDRIDVRASSTAGNWVFVDFLLEVPGGTTNVGGVNDYYVTPGSVPPTNAPCPYGEAQLSVASSPIRFRVNAPSTAAGGPVFGILTLGQSCRPGNTCLPPHAGPYAVVPPVTACGGWTNQSIDVGPGGFVMFYGILDASGAFASPPGTLYPPFVGIRGTSQAFFLDWTYGFVTTEAFNFRITP